MQLKDSELQVTDLKINNHFLFNTLNSMAAQALEGGMKPLYQSIIDLSKMLRYSVRIRGRQIPLAVELDYLEAYLKLQKLRYPVGFSYKISMDPELCLLYTSCFYSCYDRYLYRVCSDRTAYSESTGYHLSRWILMFV